MSSPKTVEEQLYWDEIHNHKFADINKFAEHFNVNENAKKANEKKNAEFIQKNVEVILQSNNAIAKADRALTEIGFDVEHSTAQHSTAQHSTAQHSTAQHSKNPLSASGFLLLVRGFRCAYAAAVFLSVVATQPYGQEGRARSRPPFTSTLCIVLSGQLVPCPATPARLQRTPIIAG